jgi:hypothetical protein
VGVRPTEQQTEEPLVTESVHPASHDDERPTETVDTASEGTDETFSEADVAAPEETAGLTGNARVDEAVRSVLEVGDRPVEEHVEVFEQAHSAMRGALNDAAAGRPAPGPGQERRPTPNGPGPLRD